MMSFFLSSVLNLVVVVVYNVIHIILIYTDHGILSFFYYDTTRMNETQEENKGTGYNYKVFLREKMNVIYDVLG